MNCILKRRRKKRLKLDCMQDRTALLLGDSAVAQLSKAHVMVIGLGGVGGTAAEALCRSGVGRLTLVDGDQVAVSNLNRQIVAVRSTVGWPKATAMKKRLEEIQPEALLTAEDCNFTEQTSERLLALQPDFIIDAIDSMADKLCLIVKCHQKGLSIISATGAGNRMDLQQLKLADVFDTQGDPVCRRLRRELRKQGVERHMVVYSQETPMRKGRPTGSMMFVPSAMGLLLAQHVVSCLKSRDDV